MIEILETEIDREELKELFENISPWDCMYSPETLVDIYIRSGPDSTRLETALGEDWLSEDMVYVTLQKVVAQRSGDDTEEETLLDIKILADAHSSECQSHAVYDFEDMDEIDFEEESYMPRR